MGYKSKYFFSKEVVCFLNFSNEKEVVCKHFLRNQKRHNLTFITLISNLVHFFEHFLYTVKTTILCRDHPVPILLNTDP